MQSQVKDTIAPSTNADYQVLLHAISSCSGVAVKQLLNLDPKLVNVKGWHGQTPLHKACLTGDLDTVQLLLSYGADPNALNDFHETPVHYASKRGIPTLVHALYQHGGKLDVVDQRGKTPVHDAAQTGSVFMLQYFAEKGFGFQEQDENQQSPLHHVCTFGHLDAFKFLLKNGRSDPRQKDRDGNTALHICAREGYSHGSWFLINYQGLSALHVQNNQGFTPLDICRQHDKARNQALVPILEDLSKLPTSEKVKGPLHIWYFHMFMPAVFYGFALLLSSYIFTQSQGIVFALVLAYIIRFAKNASHRIEHCSRWQSPLFAGLFAAGMFHTMLVYYFCIINYIFEYQLLIVVSFVLNIVQLYLYWKLLKADPGELRTGEINEKTHKPTTLTDLCVIGGLTDRFCVSCELVQPDRTKHCKLCEKCYYKMDHHCLFLLKCIGYNNHARFVWFIIITIFIMIIFLLEVVFLYVPTVYPDQIYHAILSEMFWRDGWVFSMSVLNIGSIIWAVMLTKFQLNVISKGQTTFFQSKATMLNPTERLLNVIYFLQGKPLFANDILLEGPKKCCTPQGLGRRPVHQV